MGNICLFFFLLYVLICVSLAKEHHGLDGNKSGVWECQTEKLL